MCIARLPGVVSVQETAPPSPAIRHHVPARSAESPQKGRLHATSTAGLASASWAAFFSCESRQGPGQRGGACLPACLPTHLPIYFCSSSEFLSTPSSSIAICADLFFAPTYLVGPVMTAADFYQQAAATSAGKSPSKHTLSGGWEWKHGLVRCAVRHAVRCTITSSSPLLFVSLPSSPPAGGQWWRAAARLAGFCAFAEALRRSSLLVDGGMQTLLGAQPWHAWAAGYALLTALFAQSFGGWPRVEVRGASCSNCMRAVSPSLQFGSPSLNLPIHGPLRRIVHRSALDVCTPVRGCARRGSDRRGPGRLPALLPHPLHLLAQLPRQVSRGAGRGCRVVGCECSAPVPVCRPGLPILAHTMHNHPFSTPHPLPPPPPPPRSWGRWLKQYVYTPLGATPAALALTMAASAMLHGGSTAWMTWGGELMHAVGPVDMACLDSALGLACAGHQDSKGQAQVFPHLTLTFITPSHVCCAGIQAGALLVERWLSRRGAASLGPLGRLHPHLRASLAQCATMTTLLVQARGSRGACGSCGCCPGPA